MTVAALLENPGLDINGLPISKEIGIPTKTGSVNPLPTAQANYLDSLAAINNRKTAAEEAQSAKDQKQADLMGKVAPFAGGLAAASHVPASPDVTQGVVNTLVSGASGALAGVAGGPAGVVAGGLIGLVGGGVSAYFGGKEARRQARAQDKLAAQIQAREDARYNQQRADQINQFNTSLAQKQEENSYNRAATAEEQRYTRKLAAYNAQWAAVQSAGTKMSAMVANNQTLKDLFAKKAR